MLSSHDILSPELKSAAIGAAVGGGVTLAAILNATLEGAATRNAVTYYTLVQTLTALAAINEWIPSYLRASNLLFISDPVAAPVVDMAVAGAAASVALYSLFSSIKKYAAEEIEHGDDYEYLRYIDLP